MGLISELKRRNVFRMAGLYLVACWLIIQVANNILPVFEVPTWVLKTLIIVLTIGLLPVIALSWAFEFTPEGLKRDAEVDAGSPEARNTARRLNHLLIGVLVLAVTYFAVDKFILGRAPESPVVAAVQKAAAQQERPSIAVLPFDNRSAVAEDAFFVDGMHDDILTQLSKISGLKVISRTSVEAFRDSKLPLREIARKLGVKTILEGGVQRGGNRVRINMQLIDAETDNHLWAETYDRELTAENIFAIQSEVTAAITTSLKTRLTAGEASGLQERPTQILAAWEAFQLGNQRRAKRNSASLEEAETYFKKAMALDPQFYLAQVLLADTYISQAWYSGKNLTVQLDKASAIIEVVRKSRPQMPEALSSAGTIAIYRGQGAMGERQLREVLAQRPNYVPALHVLADYLPGTGRSAEALQMIDRAISVDPLSAVLYGKRAAIREDQGLYEAAKDDYLKALEIDPGFASAKAGIGTMNAYIFNRLDQSVQDIQDVIAWDPGNPMYQNMLTVMYEDIGMSEDSRNSARQLIAKYGDNYSCTLSYAELFSGNAEASRRLAEKVPQDSCGRYWLQRQGQHQRVIDDAVRELPDLLDTKSKPTAYQSLLYYPVIYSLNAMNRQAEAKALASRMREGLKSMPLMGLYGYGLTDVVLLVQSGQHQEALTALEGAIDRGWQGPYWRFMRDFEPGLEPIRNEPRFRAAFSRVEVSVAAQRARLPAPALAVD